MKKIVLSLIIAAIISGCTGGGTTEYETSDGTVKISGGGSGPDWCMESAGYEMALTGTGDTQSMRFEGLVKSGQYADLCHLFALTTVSEGAERVDYYFDEEMEKIYIEQRVNGELIFSGELFELLSGMGGIPDMEMPEN